MAGSPADYYVEIIPGRPQGVEGIQFINIGLIDIQFALSIDTPATPIDITRRVSMGGLGSINRAMERDLLSFKTGDVTLQLRNHDGFFDDLFAFFTATTMWGLRIFRRGAVQFYGVLIGLGSINFDRKNKTLDLTAYGLTKILDMTDAYLVRRGFCTSNNLTVDAPGGSTTLTFTSTANMQSGDILHLTDQTNKEDVTIKQVTSSTAVSLEAATSSHYGIGSTVTCTTPFFRYKTISDLVTSLFKAAFIGMADLRLSNSQFNRLAPSPVNLEGLSFTNNARRGIGQYTGSWNVGIHGVNDYGQSAPDSAWAVQGFADRGLYDHSPYFVQGYDFKAAGSAYAGEPSVCIFEPVAGVTQEAAVGAAFATYWGGVDYISSPTKRIFTLGMRTEPANTSLFQRTTTDGNTFTAAAGVAVLPGPSSVRPIFAGVEYDPIRNIVYASWADQSVAPTYFQYYDLTGAAWVDCKQAGDGATTGYYGPRYVADKDYTLVLKDATGTVVGPSFTICAFRGATLLWERAFPSCLIVQEVANNPAFYPTRTARFVNGRIYIALVVDGAVQLLSSGDDFQTYTMRKLSDATSKTIIMACRMGDTYRVACYKGANPTGYFVAAPFYAGVIPYADFNGLSAAEALKKLSVLTNSLFFVDDDLQGHFVARDLYDAGQVIDYPKLMADQTDSLLWDQSAQFASASGNGVNTTSGNPAFAAQGVTVESDFIPNEAYCQALSDAIYSYYSNQRKFVQGQAHDIDGRIFRPLDRITLGGVERYLVYESDHALTEDAVTLQLLEDR